ncbi:30S ribosomal protein S6 [Clostridium sp. CAG:1193]|jgi:small subunit ribosomal protein S6|nr:30S ribosomal protein S6 [Clostridium sp. CAG:1193]
MKYEIMFIVRANLEEGELAGIVKNFEEILTKNGAKIESSKEMGQRELAYEINKHKSGYYYLYEISSKDDKAEKEFNRLANLSEDIIRHMIIKL